MTEANVDGLEHTYGTVDDPGAVGTGEALQ